MDDTPDPRPANVEGPDPIPTDNSARPDDGAQVDDDGNPISQSPDDDYSAGAGD